MRFPDEVSGPRGSPARREIRASRPSRPRPGVRESRIGGERPVRQALETGDAVGGLGDRRNRPPGRAVRGVLSPVPARRVRPSAGRRLCRVTDQARIRRGSDRGPARRWRMKGVSGKTRRFRPNRPLGRGKRNPARADRRRCERHALGQRAGRAFRMTCAVFSGLAGETKLGERAAERKVGCDFGVGEARVGRRGVVREGNERQGQCTQHRYRPVPSFRPQPAHSTDAITGHALAQLRHLRPPPNGPVVISARWTGYRSSPGRRVDRPGR